LPVCGDACEVLRTLGPDERPDVVYLDPMFPERAKSAASKKEMQVCRALAGDDSDAQELFAIAMRSARYRVVVKRWLLADPLGGPPSHQYPGQSTRYDVYVVGRR
jgi:16S rRNA (guanine1516-N2)-methyltransferase